MPICEHCRLIGGYHHDWCPAPHRNPNRVNRIRYPRPNVVGLAARRAA